MEDLNLKMSDMKINLDFYKKLEYSISDSTLLKLFNNEEKLIEKKKKIKKLLNKF